MTPPSRYALMDIDPGQYTPHSLHGSDRSWTETNCYVDVWVEVLHSLGFDPLAAASFSLSTDFDGYQWTFFKYPPEDLRAAYGIEVAEINVWKPVLDHVSEQLASGRLLTVEVDAWYLPDTSGSSYRREHVKTTIVPQMVDQSNQRLGYFHNSGYHELSSEDFEGVFRLAGLDDPNILPPYIETIQIPDTRPDLETTRSMAESLTRSHLRRRPATNPVERLAEGIAREAERIAAEGLDYFHAYAFGTLRQCGASAELAAAHARWLHRNHGTDVLLAAQHFEEVASAIKTAQFRMARMASGRPFDVIGTFDPIAKKWSEAFEVLDSMYG